MTQTPVQTLTRWPCCTAMQEALQDGRIRLFGPPNVAYLPPPRKADTTPPLQYCPWCGDPAVQEVPSWPSQPL